MCKFSNLLICSKRFIFKEKEGRKLQKFQDVYIKYLNIDIGELTSNQKDYLYNFLKHILPEDLCDIKEHKMYIELLQKLRMANVKDMEIVGEKFLTTISSLLAVGEDGVYSNGQRFIYELIQNVDDCEYSNVDDCHLDILFNYSVDPGEIIFTYNEKGFKPENVFAITGIAEKSKNISMEKIEIGEKGIGFKSVFGIAESVHIESGMFSFELFKNNFTVPVPRYENFKPVNGTRMKLKVSAESVKNIYRNMVNEYKTKQSVLNKNPILFLNKLTDLKIYFDSNRYIKFKVERKSPKVVDELLFEENVGISIDAKDYLNGMDYGYNRKIECIRYTKTILYNKEECWSRYGTDALFLKKSHKLIALFPKQDNKTEKFNGTLYSFLPTQIQMTIPMVLHVPFKLDGAREFVDSQKRNKWFKFTIEQLRKFLIEVYRHFSTVIKQDIIDYLPAIDEFFFKNTNEKVSCLLINDLKGRIVCSEKIFYTADGQYVDYKNAISFDRNETISNPKQVFKFLKCTNKLFIPNKNVNMRIFDVQIISNVAEKLLERGLKAEDDFEEIACILDEMDNDYEKVIEKNCPLKLTESQLKTVGNHQQIYKAISSYVLKCINKNEIPQIYIQAVLSEMPKQFSDDIQEYIKTAGIQSKFVSYLRKINYQFYALKEINRNCAPR